MDGQRELQICQICLSPTELSFCLDCGTTVFDRRLTVVATPAQATD